MSPTSCYLCHQALLVDQNTIMWLHPDGWQVEVHKACKEKHDQSQCPAVNGTFRCTLKPGHVGWHSDDLSDGTPSWPNSDL